MKRKWDFRENEWYHLVSLILCSYAALYMFGSMFGIDQIVSSHLIFAAVLSILFCGYRFFENMGKALWGITTGVILLLAVLLAGFTQSLEAIRSYFMWVTGIIQWQEDYSFAYETFSTILLTAAAFGFQWVGKRFAFIKSLAGIGIAVYLAISMIQGKKLPQEGVALLLTCILLFYLEYLQRSGRQGTKISERQNTKRSALIWLTPFLVLYFVIISVMPASPNALQWKLVQKLYANMKEAAIVTIQKIERLGGQDMFGNAFTGFSEEGSLAGSLLENDSISLQMETGVTLKTNVYLVGKIFDEFDGMEWLQTDQTNQNGREMDMLETMYAVKRYDADHQGDYMSVAALHINYSHLDTEYLFAPVKTWKVNHLNKKTNILREGDQLKFSKKQGYGTSYTVQYMQMNLDHPDFYEMIDHEQNYEYGQVTEEGDENRKQLLELQKAYGLLSGKKEEVTEEILESRAEEIQKLYQNPVMISDGVRQYLNEITKDADTDIEKLKAIEGALSQMTYTTAPGELREGTAFLDYFLLHSRKGYCSHFATAFVLLARAEGIPARYVQGFCAPANGQKEINVRAKMAHAWPEAYIKGVGWIPFEPTPSYSEYRYTPWEMATQNQETYGEIHYPAGAFPQYLTEQVGEEKPGSEKETVRQQEQRTIFLTAVLILAGAFGSFFLIDSVVFRRKYERMKKEEKFRFQVGAIFNLLGMMGYTFLAGETLSEFRQRIWENAGKELMPLDFISVYEEVRYGNVHVTDKILEEACQERQRMLSVLKLKKGKKYIYYRFKLYLKRNFRVI